MKHKLILVEGLPGAGKTTISSLIDRLLKEMNIASKLYQEGDLNHPADFESVSCVGEEVYFQLKQKYSGYLDERMILQEEQHYLISYGKLKQKYHLDFPNTLFECLSAKDIYELPFVENQKWIRQNWQRFSEDALGNSLTNVFECCFIQNPVTVGMIKYGVSDESVIAYVEELAEIVAGLNPLLIYINQDDIEATFSKAVQERPKEWSQGFMGYYTNQGYGKNHSLEGFSGTVEVLKARRLLEERIFNRLQIKKVVINNSRYQIDEVCTQLKRILLSS
nr:hypothetical protein [Neobacillus sp. Marseille-Q6967]